MEDLNAKDKSVETKEIKKHNCKCISVAWKNEDGSKVWRIKTYCPAHRPNYAKKADRAVRRNQKYHTRSIIQEAYNKKKVQERRKHAKKTR